MLKRLQPADAEENGEDGAADQALGAAPPPSEKYSGVKVKVRDNILGRAASVGACAFNVGACACNQKR